MKRDGREGMKRDEREGMKGDGREGMEGDGREGMKGDGREGMKGDGREGMKRDGREGKSKNTHLNLNDASHFAYPPCPYPRIQILDCRKYKVRELPYNSSDVIVEGLVTS